MLIPVVSYVTTELDPCATPECRLSALAAATLPSAHGKLLFRVLSTKENQRDSENEAIPNTQQSMEIICDMEDQRGVSHLDDVSDSET